ncbi:hypothetical protein PSPO01_05415 [Paraphaeosphaeria sporulosa]
MEREGESIGAGDPCPPRRHRCIGVMYIYGNVRKLRRRAPTNIYGESNDIDISVVAAAALASRSDAKPICQVHQETEAAADCQETLEGWLASDGKTPIMQVHAGMHAEGVRMLEGLLDQAGAESTGQPRLSEADAPDFRRQG